MLIMEDIYACHIPRLIQSPRCFVIFSSIAVDISSVQQALLVRRFQLITKGGKHGKIRLQCKSKPGKISYFQQIKFEVFLC